jgi:hypothetical protein
MKPRTFFFRCPECGSEFLHTVDLDAGSDEPMDVFAQIGFSPVCHCGATMKEAAIPRLVMPEPGGDGMIYEVEELHERT